MKIHGRAALLLIDIQEAGLESGDTPIPIMPGGDERLTRSVALLSAARAAGVPPIFVQEVHKRSLVDFGRELDGRERVHALEGDPATELAEGINPEADEYLIRKRRYSAFFATELGLVLKSLDIQTLILIGGLTDVCVHYTFADAHQHDFHLRVITDCVGGSSIEAHDASLRAMQYLQRDCLVDTAEVLELLTGMTKYGVAA